MTTEVQLSLLGNNDPLSLLMQEVQLLKHKNANVHRGLFARNNELGKILLQQQKEIDALKSMLPYRDEIMEQVMF